MTRPKRKKATKKKKRAKATPLVRVFSPSTWPLAAHLKQLQKLPAAFSNLGFYITDSAHSERYKLFERLPEKDGTWPYDTVRDAFGVNLYLINACSNMTHILIGKEPKSSWSYGFHVSADADAVADSFLQDGFTVLRNDQGLTPEQQFRMVRDLIHRLSSRDNEVTKAWTLLTQWLQDPAHLAQADELLEFTVAGFPKKFLKKQSIALLPTLSPPLLAALQKHLQR